MRRTDQEFKEEILRRRSAYRQKQRRKRKQARTASLCIFMCVTGLYLFWPTVFSAKSADNAAPEAMYQVSDSLAGEEMAFGSPAESPMEYVESAEEEAPAGEIAGVGVLRGEEILMLDAEDSTYISDCLAGEWISSAANCLCDCTFVINDVTYFYHSDCGTFRNEQGESLTVPEEKRLIINEILEKYP